MAKKHPWLRYLPLAVGAALVLLAGVALIFLIRKFGEEPEQPGRMTPQVVQIIRPPPPPVEPPPPPPPEDEVEEPLPQDTPEPEVEAPPGEQLGLDAEGVAGADGFGLAARRGGSDLIGGGGAAFAWYTGLLKDSILDALSDDDRVRSGSYRLTVRVWLAQDGRVTRVALADSTGNAELDAAIERALGRMERVREAPPIEMPQPVTLRIVSRG